MHLPPADTRSEQQTTVAARIFGIVLYDLSVQNYPPDLLHGNHSVWVRHLPDSVREKQNFLARRGAHPRPERGGPAASGLLPCK